MQKFLFLLACCLTTAAYGQVDPPADFAALATSMQVDIYWPTEDTYRPIPVQPNEYLPYQYALYSRREKMEIRYYLQPETPEDALAGMPHVRLARLLMHLASNDDDAHIAVHTIPPDDLTHDFGADWGQVSFFPPKRAFANGYQQCQLVSLYRADTGMAYILFLFNEAPPTLRDRQLAVRFLGGVRTED